MLSQEKRGKLPFDTELKKGTVIKTPEGTIYEWDLFGDGENIQQFRFLTREGYKGTEYTCEGRILKPKKSTRNVIKAFILSGTRKYTLDSLNYEFSEEWKEIPQNLDYEWKGWGEWETNDITIKDFFNGFNDKVYYLFESRYKNLKILIEAKFKGTRYWIESIVDDNGKDMRDYLDYDNFPCKENEFKSKEEVVRFIEKNEIMKELSSGNLSSIKPKIL